MVNSQKITIEHTIIPLPNLTSFWQFFFSFFHLGKKIEIVLEFLQFRWEKKCLVILYYFTTLHYQTLKQAINNNVKHICRTFGIVNTRFWEFLTFVENNFIITKIINILLHVFKIEFLFQTKSRKPSSTRMTLNIGWLFWRF